GAVPRELGASGSWPAPRACLVLLGLGAALGGAAVLSAQRWLKDLSEEARAQLAELETARFAEGDFTAVRYRVRGRRLWHRRVVTAPVPGGVSVVGALTPDRDEHDEDLDD
ncbi:unnamed protein product, partial [Prorocentrum cordatum]